MREPTNVWEERIRELFTNTQKSKTESQILWDIVNLVLYYNSHDRTLIEVYEMLDKEQFVRLIQILDGRTFKAPTKKEIEEALATAVFYYEKEVKGKDWKEIQDELDFEISPRKYGIRIRNLDNFVEQKIQEMIRKEQSDGTKQ